jgi:inner membrane protein
MDSLTQIVLGAAVGEAVAGRKMGAKAALWGAIGGTIPDLDVFLRSFYDAFDAALVHRGFSHSLLFALLAGPLLGWFSHRISKQRYEQRTWILLWTLAIVTHPMLDMFTNYGTQFLWPFDARITFNTVFVIDPLYTVPFMITLLVALFMKRTNPKRAKWNTAGIIWSCAYLLWGVCVKLVLLNNAPFYFAKSGHEVRNTIVTPMPLTSFYWQMIAEDNDNYYVGYKSLFGAFQPQEVETIPKQHMLLENLHWAGTDKTKTIRHITNGFYAMQASGDTIYCYDMRFGTTKQLTGGKIERPLMGYGMLVDNGVVQKSFPLAPRKAFKAVNFGQYIDNVFGK